MPSRTKNQILLAYKTNTEMLRKRGFKPKIQRLDNEASQILRDYIDNQRVDYQVTPAGLNRRNNAERVVQTFKNHIIAGLSSTPPKFPLNLWDKILTQELLTLNILRPARVSPQLSTYAHVHGTFDYKKRPLTPLDINCLAHVKAFLCHTWDLYAKEGFYIFPVMKYNQCHNIWYSSTSSTCICNTVK